jgi:hypothetical protein
MRRVMLLTVAMLALAAPGAQASGGRVQAPLAGEIVHVVAAYAEPGSAEVTLAAR